MNIDIMPANFGVLSGRTGLPPRAILGPVSSMSKAELRNQIQNVLREGAAGARVRESTSFDESAGPFARNLVLLGAGGLGRRTLAGLRKVGIEPLAFAENNAALW